MSRDEAARVLGLIDLTNLHAHCSADDVAELCRRADGPHGRVAAVCVWPRFVAPAVAATRGTGIRVATVVNFPDGDDSVESVLELVAECVDLGVDEIDLVVPYRTLLDGDEAVGDHAVVHMVSRVKAALPERCILKAILETGELKRPELIDHVARLALASGADFIKTSTGKTPVSATVEAVEIMLRVLRESPRIDRRPGIKPSGGIRSVVDAMRYLGLADRIMGSSWANADTFRFGASGLLDAVETELA